MKKILFSVLILIFGIHYSQTYYSQDFNTAGLNGWVSTDIDGDGKQWTNMNVSSVNAGFGSGSLTSFSYMSGTVLTPNNLITSPLINLSNVTASNAYLVYNLATYSNYPNEKYSVYVTTTNASGAITASTPVYTETVAAGGFQNRVINVSSFIGQQVYISFRHYDCTDQYYLILDNIQVKSFADYDVALKNLSLSRYGVTNTDYFIKATVKNNGAQSVNNVTLNWNDGTDHSAVIPLAAPLAIGQEKEITHSNAVNYSTVVNKNIIVSVTGVNGAADAAPADNTLSVPFNTVSQNSPKKVVIEEGTGTWCGWCPRGAVAMHNATNNMSNDFIGIAVHRGKVNAPDPMEITAYTTGTNFSSFPTMNADRSSFGLDIPGNADFSPIITERKQIIAPAALSATSSLVGRTVTFNASAVFRTNFTNANFRFAAVVIEDEVKGTTSGYNQANYYAGGTTSMGGYESKPNPVPAADMVYDHVGRMLLGGYAGQAGSIPSTLTDGQVVNYTFTADIPTAYNLDKIKVALLLLDGTTGEIVNAAGPFAINTTLGVHAAEKTNNEHILYPNPAKDYFKIDGKGKADIKIFDVSGRIILEKENAEPNTPISVHNFVKGTYLVSIKEKDAEPVIKKLIIK
ncbi:MULTISPECIES: T9SS-dependent choice-of-anchor J family protein [unclassified Chryseobacterium]|uniref:T9SS-dependent choice-of-anchor J family protein n=1 Tax=unclassified Chryseobacterium TaxID=2593645 RepID=UPI000D71B8EA|nr:MULTISPECIES: choice-of-anchor J domain-containing protein [unclassified Chryseobacterium]PWW14291.1 putative secreted protein (Por secretion system target) [Chryseobacterium sp. AG844]